MVKVIKTDDEWKKELTPEQYRVTRMKGTEQPYSGDYDQFFYDGEYTCVCCGAVLFSSTSKFDAGCGWPSFDNPHHQGVIDEHDDLSIQGCPRVEVTCHQCDAHLGHVFLDGPTVTGRRYCINSVAIHFEDSDDEKDD